VTGKPAATLGSPDGVFAQCYDRETPRLIVSVLNVLPELLQLAEIGLRAKQ
jgi:hypothetical protein